MPPTIEDLIPHRPPMRWVDELTACTDTTAQATASFPAGHYASTDGRMLETALVECVAQTMAAALGHRARAAGSSGPSRRGMLAAVSNFQILTRPPPGRTLEIETRELKRFGPMLLVEGTVRCEGVDVARGELTLFA